MKQAGKNYAKRKEAHIAAYQKYFNRISLDLGSNSQIKKPTDRRVKEFSSTADPQMAALILPIRTLSLNMFFTAGWTSRQPARHLELSVTRSLGREVHHRH